MTPIGHRLAPPRFLLFSGTLLAGLAAGVPTLGKGMGTMVAFDAAAALFLLACAPLLREHRPEYLRAAAARNDANRAGLLAVSIAVTLAVLVAVAGEVLGRDRPGEVPLVVATLVLAWLFSNTVYALHYAHLFYSDGRDGADSRGIDFPGTDEPDYLDFCYFSFTLGMTFQTSDVTIRSRRVRAAVTGQCLAAFAFNLGVIAFTVNVLGG